MTCVIGGKCTDGVVIIGDTKVTYDNRPPLYKEKIFSDRHPVVTAYAGSEILYQEFREFAFSELQVKEIPSDNIIQTVQTSGVFYMYIPSQNATDYISYQNKLASKVKEINREKSYDIGDKFEVFTAIQISNLGEAKLIHISPDGISDDIYQYKSIGGSSQYSYVFLKPTYDENKLNMKNFAKLGYSIIKFLIKFDMDQAVGGQPQFWCIPNSGDLFNDKDRPEWKQEFEAHSETIIDNFKKYIINPYLHFELK